MAYEKVKTRNVCSHYFMDLLMRAINNAISARERAYAPYSGYKVGCCVIAFNPEIEEYGVFSGCNVENASYGLTECAERVAIFNAVRNGFTLLKTVVICTEGNTGEVTSCGACRQVEYEFGGPDCAIVAIDEHGTVRRTWDLSELLPFAFGPKSLGH